ncbi:xylulose kinase-1 [Tanacetum coccineum]
MHHSIVLKHWLLQSKQLLIEHYLAHTDYPIWEVIQKGNGPVSVTTDTDGVIRVLPPRTAEETLARERERKARTILLMALPEDHLAKFHKMTDAKDIWEAIKSRFGGNDEYKKMQEEPKAMVTVDGESVDWTAHAEDEQEDFAFMAYGNSSSDSEVISCSKQCVKNYAKLKKLYDEQREQLSDASIEIKAYSQGLKKVEAQLVAHQQGQLCKLLNTQMSANDKFGLGYGDHRYDGILSYENEVLQSVFMNKESELEKQPLYDRFVTAEGMHAVPPPMTGNYMPSGPDIEVDYSQFTYGPKQTQPSDSESQTSEFDTCESNIKQETPSFANQQVKTPRETVKNQFTHSQKPKVDKKELGYGFTVRACFVCGSLNHLIRDCDFHEKRMARKAELNNGWNKKSSQRELRETWNNVQRVNKQNQFVPSEEVLTRTGKILEFKNKDVIEFCGSKGIKREYSNARTPQQNGVAERKNKTLIKAARTMLADSFLPNTFWAEAVSTACYVLNRVLVTKPLNKTPYELLTRKGPNWLFDLDYLTNSMNYHPVRSENQANIMQVNKKLTKLQMKREKVQERKNKSLWMNLKDLRGKKRRLRGAKASGRTKASSTNLVNTVSIPVSTASPHEGLSFSDPTNPEQDDSEIPPLEDIYQNSSDGIFTTSSYDDEGAVADFTNLETVVNVSPIPTSRIISSHPSALILGPDVEIDDSKFTYGPKQSQPSEYESQSSEVDTCESNISTEPSELVSEPVVNESNVECQPKVWSDAPIIEEYESYSEDEYVSIPTKEHKTPSFADQQVKTPRENVKNQTTHSQTPKVNKKELGYGFTVSTVGGKKETAVKPSAGCNWRPQRTNWLPLLIRQDFNGGPVAFGGSKGYITGGLACLIAKATADESNKWHRRGLIGFRESLRRVIDGTEALLLPTLFILWLDTVSTDSAKLVPLGKVCTAIETLKKNTAKGTNFHHQHSLGHITAKVAGKPVSISKASIRSDLLFDDANGIYSLPNQAIFDAIQLRGKHLSGKVTPLFASMLVQPTEDEGAPSEKPSEAQPTPSPSHTSEVPLEPKTDSSPAHTSQVPIEPATTHP